MLFQQIQQPVCGPCIFHHEMDCKWNVGVLVSSHRKYGLDLSNCFLHIPYMLDEGNEIRECGAQWRVCGMLAGQSVAQLDRQHSCINCTRRPKFSVNCEWCLLWQMPCGTMALLRHQLNIVRSERTRQLFMEKPWFSTATSRAHGQTEPPGQTTVVAPAALGSRSDGNHL